MEGIGIYYETVPPFCYRHIQTHQPTLLYLATLYISVSAYDFLIASAKLAHVMPTQIRKIYVYACKIGFSLVAHGYLSAYLYILYYRFYQSRHACKYALKHARMHALTYIHTHAYIHLRTQKHIHTLTYYLIYLHMLGTYSARDKARPLRC